MKLEAVIFDLDGTLIDSALTISTVLNKMRQETGLKSLEIESYRDWISLGAEQLISCALEKPIHLAAPFLDSFRELYRQYSPNERQTFPHVMDMLCDLASNNLKLAVCTNKPIALCKKILRDENIEHFFSSIVGGGDTKLPKPAPDSINLSLKNLAVSNEASVFVGDSRVDQLTAKNANISFIFFQAGYDDGVIKHECQHKISMMNELPRLIENMKLKAI